MKKRTFLFSVFYSLVFILSIPFSGQTQVNLTTVDDSSFKAFLPKWEQSIDSFINGNPFLWKQNASQTDEATIFGAFGGYGEKGWKQVGSRYDWASSQYKNSGAKVKIEYISIIVSSDIAYTVGIERSNSRLGTMKNPTGSHKIEGIGIGFIPPLWQPDIVDEILTVNTEEAMTMARRLAKEEGIFAGTSTGANIVAAYKVAERFGAGKTIATIIVDSGLRYISTSLYQQV
jgi:cysteine synthase A